MKKTLVMLSIAAVMATGFVSCKKDEPSRTSMLMGTWELKTSERKDNTQSTTVITGTYPSNTSSTQWTSISYNNGTWTSEYTIPSPSSTTVIKKNTSTGSLTITFKEDGTYERTYVSSSTETPDSTGLKISTYGSNSVETGYWYWLSNSNNQIAITLDGNGNYVNKAAIQIKSLSSSELISNEKMTSTSKYTTSYTGYSSVNTTTSVSETTATYAKK